MKTIVFDNTTAFTEILMKVADMVNDDIYRLVRDNLWEFSFTNVVGNVERNIILYEFKGFNKNLINNKNMEVAWGLL